MDGDGRNAWGVWDERTIARLGARQYAVVSNAQLRALGIHRRAISRALARGRLHRLHYGVYALVPVPALPPLAAEQAAVLACGPTAVLSHHTAARLHGLLPAGARSPIHVTVQGDRRHPGLAVHRTADLLPAERHRIHRLPVTSVARTVLDLAPHLHQRALERAVDEALKRTSRAKLAEVLARHPRRPGAARLHELLDPARPSADTWSVAEERLLGLIRRAGLPAPEVNVAVGEYVPDLLWREQRVIVEFDSVAHHSGPGAFTADRDRHNALTAAGYHVIHVTWAQLTRRPEAVLVWIATALARG